MKKLNRVLLLDENRSSHLWVHRAKVAISPRSARHDCVALIRIERGRFFELLANAYDCVRFLVPIDPRDLLTRLNGDGLRIEGKVFDLDSVLTGATAASVLHLARQGGERETGQKCCDCNLANECIHKFELLLFRLSS